MKSLSRWLALLGAAAGCAGEVRAGLRVPYVADDATLHLWSFDAPGSTTSDKGPGGITLTNYSQTVTPGSTASITDSGIAALGNALRLVATNLSAGNSYAFANGDRAEIANVVNPETGAFTFEALVKPEGNPFVANGNWEIIAADSSAAPRGWQFRIQTGATPTLNFNAFPGNNAAVNNLVTPLPASGPNAVVVGQWYHTAVTYSGHSPTNGDSAGLLRFYWTLFDANRTAADVLFETTVGAGFGLPASGSVPIAVGGSGRNFPGTLANAEGFKGFLDEVRMSIVARGSNEMAFTTGGAVNPPSFLQQPPATTTVGFGKPLTVAALVTGSQPLALQWQQQGPSGFTNVTGQTANALEYPAAVFGNSGLFRLVASNASGAVTSQVATVTVRASFSGLFQTGRAEDGALIAGGVDVLDPHYRLVESADIERLGGPVTVWDMGAFPMLANGGTYDNINGVSQWVGPQANSYTSPVGTYVYRTTFLIDGGDPATASLSGSWWVNSAGVDIRLNGVATGLRNDVAQRPGTAFALTNGFISGLNTLDFVLTNTAGGSAFRVEMSGLADPLPAGVPTIPVPPIATTVREGSKASFSVVARGRQPLRYQWRLDGQPIADATNRVLSLDAALGNLTAGTYSVVVSNDSGFVTSSGAALALTQANHPPVVPAATAITSVDVPVAVSISRIVNSAFDADGDAVLYVFTDASSTNNGVLVEEGASILYTPPTGYVGADRFFVTLSDGLDTVAVPVDITVRTPGNPAFAGATVAGSTLVVTGTNGTAGASYRIFGTTNVAAPFATWVPLATNNFGPGGTFAFTNQINQPQSFIRLQTP